MTDGPARGAGSIPERLSSAAVRDATGRGWDEWFSVLDEAGAAGWDHKAIVAHLEADHPEVSSWWRQSVSVGYEQARGLRAVGQTADAGFNVGVQRTLGSPLAEVWDLITSRPDLWLGEGAVVDLTVGAPYQLPDGTAGEVRSVRPGDRLRMTWQPPGRPAPATIQLTVSAPAADRTALSAHVEKLAGPEDREEARAYWRAALDRVVEAAAAH